MKKIGLELRGLIIIISSAFLTGAMIFLPAGTFDFWEGWAFLLVLFIPLFFAFFYMIKYQRVLLERRLKYRERREKQRFIQPLITLLFFAAMVTGGIDHRFGWSRVPAWLVILSDLTMFAGYVLFIRTMIYNEYASRTIEIRKGQKLIDTGPYALVRHPMYAAGILMYLLTPLALGSFWAIIPLLLMFLMLIFRIFDEEKALIAGLKGYKRYMKKVKCRLVPGIW